VFERDKWKCHICGMKTMPALRGSNEDSAPELDHIVSLADGGSHTWANLACACRQCNGRKGAASFGQLHLDIAA
jgi:5-methylcytosine-specific restriction endonuclease McrA